MLLLIAVLGSSAACVAYADTEASRSKISFGSFPYLWHTLVRSEAQPLVNELERELETDVGLVVPLMLQAMIHASFEDRFNLLIVPAHVAAVLISARNDRAVASTGWKLKPTIYARRGSGIESVAQLAGHRLAVPGPVSVTTLLTKRMLTDQTVPSGRVKRIEVPDHGEGLMQLISGAVDAVASVPGVLEYLQPGLKKSLVVVHELGTLPATVVLVRYDFPRASEAKIRTVLFEKMPAEFHGQPSYRVLDAEDHEELVMLEPLAIPEFEAMGISTRLESQQESSGIIIHQE
jgi:ABC-type phosphate/phosphonate transport system substrate-binding protein